VKHEQETRSWVRGQVEAQVALSEERGTAEIARFVLGAGIPEKEKAYGVR